MRAGPWIAFVSSVLAAGSVLADESLRTSSVAARIDASFEGLWERHGVKPTGPSSDLGFLRRVSLDLLGRIPTPDEAKAFAAADSGRKREQLIEKIILRRPEYPLQMGRILDRIIQGKHAGDEEFVEYLRAAAKDRTPWDRMFRDITAGPWEEDSKHAQRFLTRRVQSLDEVTTDTARVFFGVDISCAKCHDHPLVADWKQEHYYGMASFFNRSHMKKEGDKKVLAEKSEGDVTFVTTAGEKRTAKLMFLNGAVLSDEEPNLAAGEQSGAEAPRPEAGAQQGNGTAKEKAEGVSGAFVSRREILVRAALEERQFFSKAIVNHLWQHFLGRGLVEPVDQMHSANLAVVPELLDWLAEDLAGARYRLDRLVAGIVSSRVYQLASTWEGDGPSRPSAKEFAIAGLRPLTPRQYAMSIFLATGSPIVPQSPDSAAFERDYRELEARARELGTSKMLDPPTRRFQSSTTEALFLSNNEAVQQFVRPSGDNLVARLAKIENPRGLLETAFWTILSRPPKSEESVYLNDWLETQRKQTEDPSLALGELIWALLTSAEFRFNH